VIHSILVPAKMSDFSFDARRWRTRRHVWPDFLPMADGFKQGLMLELLG
jgi:hypothetical protein